MKMIIATAALAAGIASPSFAQDQPAWRADLVQHRANAFVQSARDLPLYRSEPAWQAYAQYNAGRARNAYARADIRDQGAFVGTTARRDRVQARRAARAEGAFAQADIRDQGAFVGTTARRDRVQARRAARAEGAFAQADIRGQRAFVGNPARRAYARAQDAFGQSDIRLQYLNIRNPALRAYAVRFREDAAANPLNAYAQSSISDYRVHLGYAPWHVYGMTGEYIGTDPDPLVRGMLAWDPPGQND